MQMSETGRDVWKRITGFPLYEVSYDGLVRSWAKSCRWGVQRRSSPRLLKPGVCRKGYEYVFLGRNNRRMVHLLVLEAFFGERPLGLHGCHLNDVKNDNRVENLRWGTPTENREDSRKNGGMAVGSRHPRSKLDEQAVVELRELRSRGATLKELAQRFDVHPATLGQACRRETWKHV